MTNRWRRWWWWWWWLPLSRRFAWSFTCGAYGCCGLVVESAHRTPPLAGSWTSPGLRGSNRLGTLNRKRVVDGRGERVGELVGPRRLAHLANQRVAHILERARAARPGHRSGERFFPTAAHNRTGVSRSLPRSPRVLHRRSASARRALTHGAERALVGHRLKASKARAGERARGDLLAQLEGTERSDEGTSFGTVRYMKSKQLATKLPQP